MFIYIDNALLTNKYDTPELKSVAPMLASRWALVAFDTADKLNRHIQQYMLNFQLLASPNIIHVATTDKNPRIITR